MRSAVSAGRGRSSRFDFVGARGRRRRISPVSKSSMRHTGTGGEPEAVQFDYESTHKKRPVRLADTSRW